MSTPSDLIKKMAVKINRNRLARDRYAKSFNEEWYKQAYPDVATSGLDPLDHFIRHGDKELRSPNPLFAPAWYQAQYMKDGDRLREPFQHYLTVGQKMGFAPNAAVDVAFVKTQYGLQDSDDVLAELLSNRKIDQISKWFSRSQYIALNGDVQGFAFPEVHFLSHGYLEGRKPSAFHVVGEDAAMEKMAAEPFLQDRAFILHQWEKNFSARPSASRFSGGRNLGSSSH